MSKISVIMGVYNASYRIDESINSIRNQTYQDWEFIICDDASNDNTYLKLLDWSKVDNRIIPIKNEVNLGLAASLNNCIKYASGVFIARMDDDDYSYPNRFDVQIKFLLNNPQYSFCSSNILLFDGKETIKPRKTMKEKPSSKDFLSNSCFVHPATMFRTIDLKRAGNYRIAKETKRAEDYDLFMQMYSLNMLGYNIQEPLLRYFVNLDAVKRKRKYRYRFDELIVRYKGFKKLGLLPKGFLFVLKPIFVGLIPKELLYYGKKLFDRNIIGD